MFNIKSAIFHNSLKCCSIFGLLLQGTFKHRPIWSHWSSAHFSWHDIFDMGSILNVSKPRPNSRRFNWHQEWPRISVFRLGDFWNFLTAFFLTKIDQIFMTFGFFWKIAFLSKICFGWPDFWATIAKNGLLFIPTSGHTADNTCCCLGIVWVNLQLRQQDFLAQRRLFKRHKSKGQ